MTEYSIYERALYMWGTDSQINMVVEECSELINALMKWRRNRVNNDAVVEEMADVAIMIEQMKVSFPGFDLQFKKKLKRLEDRLETAEKKAESL